MLSGVQNYKFLMNEELLFLEWSLALGCEEKPNKRAIQLRESHPIEAQEARKSGE